MHELTPLAEIPVPEPRADEDYEIRLLDRDFRFTGLKALLGASDTGKAGDRLAGLDAEDEVAREAARAILSELTVRHLHERPLTDHKGRVDTVMRVNYEVDADAHAEIADLTLGELKDRLLRGDGEEIARIGSGLTGVEAAALTKLMDVHELILIAGRLRAPTTARTTIGQRGTLSSRLQPNHPTDDLDGVTLLVYTGLSLGAGDCLIGLNPAVDTVDNVTRLLTHLDGLRRDTGAPTQICVLSHVKTQLACLERGAPVEILFQSLAGTERTLGEEFDLSVDELDGAYRTMAEHGALAPGAEQFMYFETGQGSELTYDKHDGIDMATCEALCYGLARRYDPFMVNNVTGFIGPETHRDDFEMILANLQDHFMGKLLGLPMGMAPCYTLHSEIGIEGHQMATQMLTAAGANYFMDVYLSIDRMLAYFDTSGHDDQTLREIHGLTPAVEYLEWALERGIFARDGDGPVRRGPRWGDPATFCDSEAELARLHERVPAAYGFDNAGPRPANRVTRAMRADQALAREAIRAELDEAQLGEIGFRTIATAAANKEEHLNDPGIGARLASDELAGLEPEDADVQIVVSDGLSAEAVHRNVPELLPVLLDGLASRDVATGTPILVPYGRVKVAEAVGDALEPQLVIVLIGERPGGDARSSRSLSAYLAFRITGEDVRRAAAEFSGRPDGRYEYTVISNVYEGGLPPAEAGSVIAERALAILEHRAAGNRLEHLLRTTEPAPRA
jgi:ethanolamine ammonia-lyase large subunit